MDLFVRLDPGEVTDQPEASTRLYVFPHAGGGPGALGALAAAWPPTIELWALNLPGRQARIAETPRTDLEPLTAEIVSELMGTPCEYSLFGYCGGALLAYLAARQSKPAHLFVGSYAAPDLAAIPRRLHTLPNDRFWEVVLSQGGVPPELAQRTDLRPLLEKAIRADFALYAQYHHSPGAPLGVPITVLYGRDDIELAQGALLGWRRQSGSRPDLCELAAGHWLIDEDPTGVVDCITGRILDGVRTPARGNPVAQKPRAVEPSPQQPPDNGETQATVDAIARAIRDVIGRPIDEDENFFDAGLTSARLVQVHLTGTQSLADPFPVTAMFAYPNMRTLRTFLVDGEASLAAAAVPALDGEKLRRAGQGWRELRRQLRSESERA